MMDQYEQVMADLVKELGLDRLSQEKQEELMAKMGEVLVKRIYLETMEKLGEADAEVFEKLSENASGPEEVGAFLNEKILGYNDMVIGIVNDFKTEMKQGLS
jgi:hypothetical protein